MKKNNVLILGYGQSSVDVINHMLKHNVAKQIFVATKQLNQNENYHKHLKQDVIFLTYDKNIYQQHHFDLVIKSPGIEFFETMVFNANKKEIEIISEIEYALNFLKTKNIIAVSGSNGKTTLSTLTYEILKNENKQKVYLCGNIGITLVSLLDQIQENDIVVLELSSFQLNDTKNLKPRVGVITNIDTNTHTNWHLNFKNYLKAKENLVINQDIDDVFVVNIDDEYLWDLALKTMSSIISFSTKSKLDEQGSYVINNTIYYKEEPIINLDQVTLLGKHNLANMLAAVAIVKQFNVSCDSIVKVFTTFKGVEHRQEFVGKFNNINVYNDSKATNEVSLITALEAMKNNVVLICGGLDRGVKFTKLNKYNDKLVKVFTYGECKDSFDQSFDLEKISKYDDFSDAVLNACKQCVPGQTLLLSCGCASWDQFKNFEQRGTLFKQIVKKYFEEVQK